MIALHVLSLIFGAVLVAGDPRVRAQDGRAAPRGVPAPGPGGVRRRLPPARPPLADSRTGDRAPVAVRAGRAGQPAARVDALMVVAFTFIFWGTGSLTCRSGPSRSAARRSRRWGSPSRVRPAGSGWRSSRRPSGSGSSPSSSAICRRSTRPTTGGRRASSGSARSRVRPRRVVDLLQTPAAHRGPGQLGVLAQPVGMDPRHASRRTRRSRSSRTSPRPTGTTRGWRPSARCSTPPRSSSPRTETQGSRFLRGHREGPDDGARLRHAGLRPHGTGRDHPASPSRRGSPRWSVTSTSRPPPSAISRAEYDEAMTAARAPHRRRAGRRRRRGAASPGSGRATSPPLRSLAGLTFAYPAPWTTDRAARRRPAAVPAAPGHRGRLGGQRDGPRSGRAGHARSPTGG